MGKAHNLQPFPRGCEGQVILTDIVIRSFDYVEENFYFKILIKQFWVKKLEGGKGSEASLPAIFLVI